MIRSKADRDRLRQRAAEQQKRKALLARLAVRGIYPKFDPKKPPSIKDLKRMIREYDRAGGTIPPAERGAGYGTE